MEINKKERNQRIIKAGTKLLNSYTKDSAIYEATYDILEFAKLNEEAGLSDIFANICEDIKDDAKDAELYNQPISYSYDEIDLGEALDEIDEEILSNEDIYFA